MIKFQVDDQHYRIELVNEPYQQLYLFYEPLGNHYQYEGDSIRLKQIDPKSLADKTYVLVPLASTATWGMHNRMLPIGRYRCSLYSNFERSEEPILFKEIFIGAHIEIIMYRHEGRLGFDDLFVGSYYKLPRNSVYLTFEKTVGEKIYLPEMVKNNNGMYRTRCILPSGAYERLTVAISQDIQDCVHIRKE